MSFDPRGVGRSAGVQCEDDEQLDAYFQQDATPDDAAERDGRSSTAPRSSTRPARRTPAKILPYVGTTDAARDMDLMRQVLGDDKLHYFGISYGTELGGVYAHLFPKNVGRAVFDAVVDPTQTRTGLARPGQGLPAARSTTSPRTARRRREDCPVGDTAQDIKDRIVELLEGPRPQADPRHLPPRADPDRGHQRHRAGPVLPGLLAVPNRASTRPTTATAGS